jgi:hypothetical protein
MRIDFTVITSGHKEEIPGQKQQAKTERAKWLAFKELIPGYVHLLMNWIDAFMKPRTQPGPARAKGVGFAPVPDLQHEVGELLELRDRAAFELGQKDRAAGRAKRTSAEILEQVTLLLPAEMLERLAPGSGEALVTAYGIGYEGQVTEADKPWGLASHPEKARRVGREDGRTRAPRKQTDEILASVGLDVVMLPVQTLEHARQELRAQYDAAYDAQEPRVQDEAEHAAASASA